MNIKTTINPTLKDIPADYSTLRFGHKFTDHMLIMPYRDGQWQPAEIIPYGPLHLDPAACCLHYGQEIFEGMKCYGLKDGSMQLFRPRENFKRMNNSAKRMCMPEMDVDYVIGALKELLKVERRWVPSKKGTALYIRPTMIADEPFLGVHAANEYLFFIILSPVGAYFKGGFKPVKILVEDKYVRAGPGGVGNAKTAGNYAASLMASEIAEKKGFSQVLWLDGVERRFIAEVGAMNIAFKINDEVITPALDGTILPGITRNSVLTLCKHLNIKMTERNLSIEEVIQAAEDGSLKECFGMGTAAAIAPVGVISYKDQEYIIGNNQVGQLSQQLFDKIVGIQNGLSEDLFGWTEKVE